MESRQSPLQKAGVMLIRFYQKFISPLLGHNLQVLSYLFGIHAPGNKDSRIFQGMPARGNEDQQMPASQPRRV
jgi:hypothetical protein